MLVVALLVAAQDVSPPTPEVAPPARVHDEVARAVRWPTDARGRAHRAGAACGCSATGCDCDPAALKDFDTVFTTVSDRPAALSASARPMFVLDDEDQALCVVAFLVDLSSAESEIIVDWSKVVLLADGVAHPAIPGYARKITSSLQQRPISAPKGARISEKIFALDREHNDGSPPKEECIGRRLATIVVDLPVKIGASVEHVTFTETPTTTTSTEDAALVDLREPSIGHHATLSCCALLGESDNDDDVAVHAAWRKMQKRLRR